MKRKLRKLLEHPLVSGSMIVVFGNLFANIFNFLYNLFMSRNLSVSDYGVLASVTSLIAFPAIASTAVMPLVVQFAGKYFASGQLAMVRGFYLTMMKFFLFLGIGGFLIFFLFIPQIKDFFHIKDSMILLITDFVIFLTFMNVVNMSFLQAKLAFGFQVFLNLIGTTVKFALGALFVLLGYSVIGGIWGILISIIIGYSLSFIPIRFVFHKSMVFPKINKKPLMTYGIPAALTLFGLTAFIASDIILVKHFFPSELAGIYAGMSLIGRVIFYVSAPIASVMFPVIVQKVSKGEDITNTFILSLVFVFMPSSLLTLTYYFFPDFMILLFLKKTEYLMASSLLWLFGSFITIFSLLSLISNFYLSIKKTKIYIPILGGALLQVILIYLFHSNFLQVILISLGITFVLMSSFLLYYPYATKK